VEKDMQKDVNAVDETREGVPVMAYVASFAAGSCVGALLIAIGMAVFW